MDHTQPLAHVEAKYYHIRLQELPVTRACGIVKLKPKRAITELYIINKRLVPITERCNVSVGLLPRGAMAYPPRISSA